MSGDAPVELLIENLRLEVEEDEATALARRIAARLGVDPQEVEAARVVRRSLDARRKRDIHWSIAAEARIKDARAAERAVERGQARLARQEPPPGEDGEIIRGAIPRGTEPLRAPPVVVGTGPGGLFAALLLAREGYRPLVLERGHKVDRRVRDVATFDEGGSHDPESNILFGEGGAGTFSDGKLTCRTRTPLVPFIYEVMVECKAPPDILVQAKPHVGTDRLRAVLVWLRRKLEALGTTFRFEANVVDLERDDRGAARAVVLASGERVEAGAVLLAPGHSARDTYAWLRARGVPLEWKPFQMGLRVEHPQELIDRAQYGPLAASGRLPVAEYALVCEKGVGGVPGAFSFCMCPGGQIMASISEPEHFCTNGMSRRKRDSGWASSGLVFTVDAEDIPGAKPGADPFCALELQRALERRAFELGERAYKAPAQRAHDFLAGRTSRPPFSSSYPRGHAPADLRDVLPARGGRAIAHALRQFDGRIPGFAGPAGLLVGPESRGSSPVRIVRDAKTRESPGVAGLYPIGEGAGFAGGIVSAAIDGLRSARALVARYAPAG